MSAKVKIPETVILEMQHKVREFRDEVKGFEVELDSIRANYNAVEKNRAYAALKLRETLDFLQEHNADATKSDWFSEVKQSRSLLLVAEVPLYLERQKP